MAYTYDAVDAYSKPEDEEKKKASPVTPGITYNPGGDTIDGGTAPEPTPAPEVNEPAPVPETPAPQTYQPEEEDESGGGEMSVSDWQERARKNTEVPETPEPMSVTDWQERARGTTTEPKPETPKSAGNLVIPQVNNDVKQELRQKADADAKVKETESAANDYLAAWQRRQAEIDRQNALEEANAEDRRRRQALATATYLARSQNREVNEGFGPRYLLNPPARPSNPFSAYTKPGTPVTPNKAAESGPNIPQPAPTVQGEPTVEALADQYGIPQELLNNPDFQNVYNNLKSQGQTNSAALSNAYARFQGKQSDAAAKQVNETVEQIESGMDNVTREQHQEIVDRVKQQIEDANAYAASRRNGYEYVPPRESIAGTPGTGSQSTTPTGSTTASPAPTTTPTTPGTTTPTRRDSPADGNRPGADAALPEVMNGSGSNGLTVDYEYFPWLERPKTDNADAAPRAAAHAGSGNNTGTGAGTNTGTSSNTGTGTGTNTGTGTTTSGNYEIPKGSQYFTPSYGQDMKYGVKAPYKYGGYTLEELEGFGNVPRSDYKYNNGKPAYEGYYLAPNGNYYPVDQAKANYWRQNGGSYRGWDEGMRSYYNKYGTFYGYRGGGTSRGGGGGSRRGGGGYSYSGRNVGGGYTYAPQDKEQSNVLYYNGMRNWSF